MKYDHELLTQEEEYNISSQMKAARETGEKENFEHWRNKLIEHNVKLVAACVEKFRNYSRSLAYDDLLQEGFLGLMKACEQFDPDCIGGNGRKVKFSTYSVWWINQAISRAILEKDRAIVIPVNLLQSISAIRKYNAEYLVEHGEMPTFDKVREKFSDMSDKAFLYAWLDESNNVLSLNQKVKSMDSVEDTELSEFVPSNYKSPEDELIENDMKKIINDWFKECKLKAEEIDIINRRFGLNGFESQTLEEIGNIYGVTRERIRQREEMILAKLGSNNRIAQQKGQSEYQLKVRQIALKKMLGLI